MCSKFSVILQTSTSDYNNMLYIYRERETERQRDRDRETESCFYWLFVYFKGIT